MKNEDFMLEEDEVHERQEGFQEIWDMLRKREALWRQKSRSNWVKLGDANTRFFHKIANGRKACNGIVGLSCDGQWVEEPEMVKKVAVDYFQKFFCGESWNRPKPSGITFKQITEEMRVWLERPFLAKEIEDGLKNCEGNKAPGPDGYNFNFIKFAWNSLKEDFVSFFGEFHQHGRFGFGVRWRGWIKECLSTARISVLVNGSPTEEFMIVKKAESEGLLHGIDVGSKGLTISLLQFADDTVILGKANGENIFTRWLNGASSVLRCGVGELPFVYLGMPVGGNPGTKKLWDPVLNKFRTKLAVWKSALLSFGGRITLLNSRDFLWGGAELKRKIPWVSWEMVCRSKEKGGLGVMDLRRRNWALLGKWWFRLGEGGESLWKRVVWDKYYGGRREVDIRAVESVRMSRIWRDVISVRGSSIKLQDMLGKGFRWMVGDGRQVGFWHEIWVGDISLKELCPRLCELAMNKDGMVSEMGMWEGGFWRWNVGWRRGRLGREKGEEAVLWEVLSRVQITEGREDCWTWRHDAEGRYAVKTAYEFLSPTESILPDQICNVLVGSAGCDAKYSGRGDGAFLVAGSVFSLVDWKLNPRECADAMRKHRSLLRAFHKHKDGKHDE
ncbi:hypothetical protein SLEP1_g20455 [Rubroshorea leprosula]|uniref:Uncharacterized protein n=1 Tax=Rubroshorea leprosula TaxID=152421 RepID=A0AAV5J2U6_9ROSI|nr:hypothetical protein SLEP1_g20455 [Rubroshorea leprosula]